MVFEFYRLVEDDFSHMDVCSDYLVSSTLQPMEAAGDWRKNIEDKADRKKMFETS